MDHPTNLRWAVYKKIKGNIVRAPATLHEKLDPPVSAVIPGVEILDIGQTHFIPDPAVNIGRARDGGLREGELLRDRRVGGED